MPTGARGVFVILAWPWSGGTEKTIVPNGSNDGRQQQRPIDRRAETSSMIQKKNRRNDGHPFSPPKMRAVYTSLSRSSLTSFATLSRSSDTSVTTSSAAPKALATIMLTSPIGPAPRMATFCPGCFSFFVPVALQK